MATVAAQELSTSDFPTWLTWLSAASLVVAAAFALVVLVDVLRHPRPMAVMNVVWPLTMLFGSALWFGLYRKRVREEGSSSMPSAVAVGASHCGAGCTVGDIVGELGFVLLPAIGALAGLGSLYGDPIFAHWIVDFVVAFLAGIAFQYFSIAPMRDLGPARGVWAAVKADTASITSWQVGMYGVMAIGQFLVFTPLFGARASVLSPEFWFMMQLAMLGGFVTAYPVNWLLIRIGVKERM